VAEEEGEGDEVEEGRLQAEDMKTTNHMNKRMLRRYIKAITMSRDRRNFRLPCSK